MIGLQTAQASFHAIHDVIARGATVIGTLAHRADDLGRHNHFVPFALQRHTQGRFRIAFGIDIGGVK